MTLRAAKDYLPFTSIVALCVWCCACAGSTSSGDEPDKSSGDDGKHPSASGSGNKSVDGGSDSDSSSKGGTASGSSGASGSSDDDTKTASGGSKTPSGGSKNSGGGGSDDSSDPDSTDQDDETPLPDDGPAGCGLPNAAFCDTFDYDNRSPGGRAVDLDDAEWSVSRVSGLSNPSQGAMDWWDVASTSACGETRTGILPGSDFFFCEETGRLVNAYEDGGGFTVQSMRVRRPFDFSGRTGVISFDVDGQSLNYLGHGFWWNFMLTEDPEPTPYQDGGALQLFSRNGFGIEFQGGPYCDDYDATQNSVSLVFDEHDHETTSWIQPEHKCFPTAEGVMNHVEIRVSKDSVDVLVSDPGKPDTLKNVLSFDKSSAPNMFPLTFSRGYIHLQHSHYNASKSGKVPGSASYQWDNVAFDGPAFPTPRSYEVPDYLLPNRTGLDVGYDLYPDSDRSFVLKDVDLSNTASGLLTLNTDLFEEGNKFSYRFNGKKWHEVTFYFPSGQATGSRPILQPVALDDLVEGDNTLDFHGDLAVVIENIELTLVAE